MSLELWDSVPAYVKLILIGLCAATIIAMVRCVKLGRKLLFNRQLWPSPKEFSNGELPAEKLANYALSHASPPHRWYNEQSPVSSELHKVAQGLRSARFAYLCDECFADVVAVKRSARLTVLTAILTIAYFANPMIQGEGSSYLSTTLYRTTDQLLQLLSFQLSLGALQYCLASLFEVVVDRRRNSWQYFYARLELVR
jgi:hypothetical protein